MRSRQLLARKKGGEQPFERHHILPKALGGANARSNLVLLTPREHFLAHLLLVRFTQGREKAKMAYALILMCANNPQQSRVVTSRHYESAKRQVRIACSGPGNFNFGLKKSEDEKAVISRRMTGAGNHQYGKKSWNAGLTLKTSAELREMAARYRQKIVAHPELRLGYKLGHKQSQAMKDKVGAAHRGVAKSAEHRRNLSDALIAKGIQPSSQAIKKSADQHRGVPHEKVPCPRCGKTGGRVSMLRWHFENCRIR